MPHCGIRPLSKMVQMIVQTSLRGEAECSFNSCQYLSITCHSGGLLRKLFYHNRKVLFESVSQINIFLRSSFKSNVIFHVQSVSSQKCCLKHPLIYQDFLFLTMSMVRGEANTNNWFTSLVQRGTVPTVEFLTKSMHYASPGSTTGPLDLNVRE